MDFMGLRWRLVLFAGLAVAALGWVIVYSSVYAYAIFVSLLTSRPASDAEIQVFSEAMIYGGPVLHLGLVLLAARWVSLRTGYRFVACGLYVGLVSTVAHQVIWLYDAGPFRLDQAARYLAAALVGGWLGGLWGRQVWRRRGALYNTSLRVNSAENAGDVVAAIGEHLAGPDVSGVALWATDPAPEFGGGYGGPWRLTTLASWAPQDGEGQGLPPEALSGLKEAVASRVLGETPSPVVLRHGELPEQWRGPRGSHGAGSALLVPLRGTEASGASGSSEESGPATSHTSRASVLVIASRRKLQAPAKSVVRDYQTIGAQAALALENMRLLEEARRAGREAGVLVERQRLAHEIHDTLAQGFNSIVINLETAEKRLPPDSEAARSDLDVARSTARESLAEARRLIWALRPEALDRHSLPEALQTLAGRWSVEGGASAGVNVVGAPRRLPTEVETALLRTAQETLSNVRKHARADRVMLTLSYMESLVVLDARDDGVGFDPEEAQETSGEPGPQDSGGFGLRAMRERVSQLGGSVTVESAPGEGTSLAVELPLTGGERERTGNPAPELEPARDPVTR